jgi:hypothetical protein
MLGRRVRVPLIHRLLPLWVLLAVGTPVVLFGGGAAAVATSQPVFCTSCHEMDLHYATWRQSSHRDVPCEECHVMPGMVSMFKSKLAALRLVRRHAVGDVRATAIQGHVPDANCRRCHTSTDKLVTYHGLKITHQAHWNMGVSCTFCHDRVVHGPKWLYTGVTSEQKKRLAVSTAYTFTPTMETCYKCHDGKKAPNTCTTCHVSLSERAPSAFDAAWVEAHTQEVKRSGERSCDRCHTQDFCQNCHRSADPHPRDWIARHPAEAREDASGCHSCHLAPAEHRPAQPQDMAFCQACHGLRREHKQADWGQVHGKEALAQPAECQQCHTQNWCASCHSITRPHPQDWLTQHPSAASANPKSCQTCHTQQFCDSCHKSKRLPPSHTANWLVQHESAALKPNPGCSVCHRQSFCDECHKTAMPHPSDWVRQHAGEAERRPDVCQQCHRQETCDACHRGALPQTHAAKDWVARHGSQAKQKGTQCLLCHRSDFCLSCHGIQMPHPAGWAKTPHAEATQSNRDLCLRCHQEADCMSCHGLTMPHPDTWLADHGRQALASPDRCARCHQAGQNDCDSCHSALAPSSHNAPDWAAQHSAAGAKSTSLCALCHGDDSCNACHAKQARGAPASGKAVR